MVCVTCRRIYELTDVICRMAFSYYSVRESKHIPNEQKRLEALKASHLKLKEEQTKLQEKFNKVLCLEEASLVFSMAKMVASF